jgi:3-methyl-2-oxobutanoate hydroxymethyltransferase
MSSRPQPPAPAAGRVRRLTVRDLIAMKQRGERIAMVTAYDAPSAAIADEAGLDALLVGDSAAMTVLGHDSTLPITMDEMVMLTAAVVRGSRRPVVVADLPFGAFQVSDATARRNAVRLFKEAGADAVKLEGGCPILSRVRAIVDAGMPVIGHLGLTPQSVKSLGGYKPQARTAAAADALVASALALEAAGCSAIVLEATPPEVSGAVTAALQIPTVGIGAGDRCDGQVLVWHDLLGISAPPLPRFVKTYAALRTATGRALERYVRDVRTHRFPRRSHTYAMVEGERERFLGGIRGRRR